MVRGAASFAVMSQAKSNPSTVLSQVTPNPPPQWGCSLPEPKGGQRSQLCPQALPTRLQQQICLVMLRRMGREQPPSRSTRKQGPLASEITWWAVGWAGRRNALERRGHPCYASPNPGSFSLQGHSGSTGAKAQAVLSDQPPPSTPVMAMPGTDSRWQHLPGRTNRGWVGIRNLF